MPDASDLDAVMRYHERTKHHFNCFAAGPGERAFRYCQHDAGHAIGTVRIAAAALGWSALVLEGIADETIGMSRPTTWINLFAKH